MLPTFIIDFDSTIVKVEALDELAHIALAHNPDKEKIAKKIKDITRAGMEGEIDFPTSLAKRLALFKPTQDDVDDIVVFLKEHLTPSLRRNKAFFQEYHDRIYIISGGLREYIYPVVKEFGIAEDHVIANTFTYDVHGNITGFDKDNPLAQVNGKGKAVAALKHKGKICVIGDGITDYQIKEQGEADIFFAFTENVHRKAVVAKADKIIRSFDELLFAYQMPRSQSYPTSKMKVLLLENISEEAAMKFREEGYMVETMAHSFTEKELIEKISDISILGIRTKTAITKEIITHAKKLLAIGSFCIGTDKVDLSFAAEKGIASFNAPYSNTRSVAEMIIGEIIMLSRRTFEKSTLMHKGFWNKSATFSHEVRGRKLGIIGYGHIGSQLSVLAESLGLQVYFYNTSDKMAFGNAKKCESMEEVMRIADIVTIHVSGKPDNKNLIDAKAFAQMKDGVLFLNASRGFVVEIDALVQAIKSGKVGGAAIDVYPTEPKGQGAFVNDLQNLPNVILTPHLGSGTEESQKEIAYFVSQKITDYINTGSSDMSVNFPSLSLPEQKNTHRFIHVHDNTPGVLAQINTIFAKKNVNIEGQYLKTNEQIGYVITDIAISHDNNIMKLLTKVKGTIRVRVLY